MLNIPHHVKRYGSAHEIMVLIGYRLVGGASKIG